MSLKPSDPFSVDNLRTLAILFKTHLCGRSTTQNAWVNQTSKLDMGDVAGRAINSLKVPNCLGSAITGSICDLWQREEGQLRVRYVRGRVDLI